MLLGRADYRLPGEPSGRVLGISRRVINYPAAASSSYWRSVRQPNPLSTLPLVLNPELASPLRRSILPAFGSALFVQWPAMCEIRRQYAKAHREQAEKVRQRGDYDTAAEHDAVAERYERD